MGLSQVDTEPESHFALSPAVNRCSRSVPARDSRAPLARRQLVRTCGLFQARNVEMARGMSTGEPKFEKLTSGSPSDRQIRTKKG
jgi:hypothetical protein